MDNNSKVNVAEINPEVLAFLSTKVFGGNDKREVGYSFKVPANLEKHLAPREVQTVISADEFDKLSPAQKQRYNYDDERGTWCRKTPYVAAISDAGVEMSIGKFTEYATARKFDSNISEPTIPEEIKKIEGFQGKVIDLRGNGMSVVAKLKPLEGVTVYLVAMGKYHSTNASADGYDYSVWAY